MKQINSGAIVVNEYQRGVLAQKRKEYLEHLPQRGAEEKPKGKVYCGRCLYYEYEEDDYCSHQGCKKIKHPVETAVGISYMNGYAREINEKNDCKEFRRMTQEESRKKNIRGFLTSDPIMGLFGTIGFLAIGLAVVSLISLVVTGNPFFWVEHLND